MEYKSNQLEGEFNLIMPGEGGAKNYLTIGTIFVNIFIEVRKSCYIIFF